MTTIRTAQAADLPDLAVLFDLYRQFYAQAPNLPLAHDFISHRFQQHESELLVAETEDAKLVGFCQLYPSFCSLEAKPIYVLYDLFVHPTARQQGIARLLLQAAERKAKAAGKTRMDLTTAKNNHAAQALYESLGWIRDEVFYTYNLKIS